MDEWNNVKKGIFLQIWETAFTVVIVVNIILILLDPFYACKKVYHVVWTAQIYRWLPIMNGVQPNVYEERSVYVL